MAIIAFTGFEQGDVTSSEVEAYSGTGGSYSSSTVRTGAYAYRSNPTTTNSGYQGIRGKATSGAAANLNNADLYISFYWRAATLPAANNEPIFGAYDSVPALKFRINITSTGLLQAYNSAGTQLGSNGATTLVVNTWYKISVRSGTGASGNYEIKINDVSELSGTGNLLATNNASIRLGKIANINGQTCDFFYDDVAVDDAGLITGDVQVKRMLPTANGATMTWTSGTGASNYTQIDEVPCNEADYVQSPTSATHPYHARFALDSCANSGISGTIKGVQVSTRTRENTTVTSACNTCKIWSGASTAQTTSLNLSTTYTPRTLLQLTDPDTATAWTTTGLDAMEAGATENNNVAVRLAFVLVSVLFVVSSGTIGTLQDLTWSSVGTLQGTAKASVSTLQGATA